MLKHINKEEIKKWTELNALGKAIKRVYIRSKEKPVFSFKDIASVIHDQERLKTKKWDDCLEKSLHEDKDEFFYIGDKDINNLYISQTALESYLMDVDYAELPSEEIKKRRKVYTYLLVNPKEYNEKVAKSKDAIIEKNNRTSFNLFLAALKTHKTRSLPFKGICKTQQGMYRVKTYKGTHKVFTSIEEAAKEYDKQIYEKYGDQVIPYLNFPEIYQKKEIPIKRSQERTEMTISVELEKYIEMKISQKMLELYKELNDIILTKLSN